MYSIDNMYEIKLKAFLKLAMPFIIITLDKGKKLKLDIDT